MICPAGLICVPAWSAAGFGAILGLVAGSYLATVLSRWPRGESANAGRSHCASCGAQLGWSELVPLVSFALLKGRCAKCGSAIDPVLPLVEALCALTGAWLMAAGLPGAALLVWLLVTAAMFDALYLWLPNRLVGAIAAVAIVIPPWQEGTSLAARVAAGLIGFAALWLIARGFRWVTGRNGMGGGDPKLFGALGLWLGPLALAPLMVAACAIGLVDALMRHGRTVAARQVQLPLGTYLAASAILFALVAPGIAHYWPAG